MEERERREKERDARQQQKSQPAVDQRRSRGWVDKGGADNQTVTVVQEEKQEGHLDSPPSVVVSQLLLLSLRLLLDISSRRRWRAVLRST